MELRRLSSVGAIFTLLIGIAFAGAALAEEPEDHSAFYLGIGAGFGFENFDGIGGVDVDAAFGFDAWGGYRFNKWIATELQLEYLNGFDATIGVDIEGQAVTFGANLKLFPLACVLNDRIQPFVMAGPGFTWVQLEAGGLKVDELDFSARFGGGIDFWVTDNVALQASSSYVLTTGDLDGTDYISLVAGIQYKF